MKAALFLTILATGLQLGWAEDVTFTNRTATFADLQGKLYRRVQLVRGDLDGLIWRDGASGGRICYTNLSPDLLESFGISSNRVEVARARAQKKAIADARYRAQVIAQPRPKAPDQFAATNAPALSVAGVSPSPYAGQTPDNPYGQGTMYPPFLFGGDLGPPAPSAQSAASAPSAGAALGAAGAPGAFMAPGATPSAIAPGAVSVAPARSAPSAPPAFVPPAAPHRHR